MMEGYRDIAHSEKEQIQWNGFLLYFLQRYSRDLKTDPLKNQKHSQPGLLNVSIEMVVPFKNWTICPVFKWLGLKWSIIDV